MPETHLARNENATDKRRLVLTVCGRRVVKEQIVARVHTVPATRTVASCIMCRDIESRCWPAAETGSYIW